MIKNLVFIALLMLTAIGCKKNQPAAESTATSSTSAMHTIAGKQGNDIYFVNLETATLFAQGMTKEMFLDHRYGGIKRTIASYFTMTDRNNKTALYVFNFDDGGYVVLSADFRFQPVCAFVEEGKMEEYCVVPSMLGIWYAQTVQCVEVLREGLYDNGIVGIQQWGGYASLMGFGNEHFDGGVLYPDDPSGGDYSGGGAGCGTTTITTKGPLLRTLWGQGRGYNNQCPHLSCTAGNGPNALTGCVATAMAQIIRYWHPSNTHYRNYNYAPMPDQIFPSTPNSQGTGQVHFLMADAGISINMNYGCSSSGADGGFFNWLVDGSYVPGALGSKFNLNGGNQDDYNDPVNDRWMILNDIDFNRPVILSGFTDFTRFFGMEWGSGGGHMWVCDGYRRERNRCSDEVWFHMNWGWDGAFNNWYYQSNWDWVPQSGSNYQYMNDVIHNIHN